MQIILSVIFIILGIVAAIIEYLMEFGRSRNPTAKKELDEYMIRSMIIG